MDKKEEAMNEKWAYIKPWVQPETDPADHECDRLEDCQGDCMECGRSVPLGYFICAECAGE